MKIAAVIAEYNPFHKAHKKHLQILKQIYDAVVIVLSGNLVQRGDFAAFNKWTRAEAALLCGADLVLELPTLFCCASAEKFAHGAIKILKELNCINTLSFGSELGEIPTLKKIATMCKTIDQNPKMKINLKKGLSYPKARSVSLEPFTQILKSPNNTLGIEYIKASINLNLKIKFHTIKRIGPAHDSSLTTNIASSKYIREHPSLIKKFVPEETLHLWNNKVNVPDEFLFYCLKMKTLNQFKNLPDVTEGLENRLFKAANLATNLNEFFKITKTKRYTMSRLKRISLYAIFNLEKQYMKQLPTYSRILGFNSTGQKIAAQAKKNKNFLISSNFKTIAKKFPYSTQIDAKVTNIISMFQTQNQPQGLDFIKKPIII